MMHWEGLTLAADIQRGSIIKVYETPQGDNHPKRRLVPGSLPIMRMNQGSIATEVVSVSGNTGVLKIVEDGTCWSMQMPPDNHPGLDSFRNHGFVGHFWQTVEQVECPAIAAPAGQLSP